MNIQKASGELTPFSEEKLKASLLRSGASTEMANAVLGTIREHLHEGMTTKKLYRIAFNELKRSRRPVAARYKLKRAIMELGPSGFPFEKYVGEILRAQGYKVVTGQIVQGKCVKHEIDVIAEQDHTHCMIECKYHNQQGIACDVKIPLYVQARFKDVESAWKLQPTHETKFHQGWVVTNTRFTTDAIQYGSCAGLHLLGWNYPVNDNLKDLIERFKLYPITCLTTLSKFEKQQLLQKHVVLCSELCLDPNILSQLGLKEERLALASREADELCKPR